MIVLGMNLGAHAGFIIAAYAAGIVVVAGLIAWVVADYAAQKRLLGELERQGVTRRSQKKQ
ncbi:MAG: heme exporter protein CcmD [Xanthobacteraceae bacterium]|jgi:heme exporter protein D|uniref:heme exporter protein CcmD n=1 Tax=Pseudolabrys sp. TaxID=1960880 RepID=UPI003D13E151